MHLFRNIWPQCRAYCAIDRGCMWPHPTICRANHVRQPPTTHDHHAKQDGHTAINDVSPPSTDVSTRTGSGHSCEERHEVDDISPMNSHWHTQLNIFTIISEEQNTSVDKSSKCKQLPDRIAPQPEHPKYDQCGHRGQDNPPCQICSRQHLRKGVI